MPRLTFLAARSLGCSAGFVNAAYQGSAMRWSGMLAAEAAFDARMAANATRRVVEMKDGARATAKDLFGVRNVRSRCSRASGRCGRRCRHVRHVDDDVVGGFSFFGTLKHGKP